MDYTSAPGYVTDAQGRRQYQDRDLLNGIKGTSLVAVDRNAVMNALMYLIQAVQIVPNPNDDSQVWAAIEAMIKAALAGAGGSLDFMPVQQGGGPNQTTDKINLGQDATYNGLLRLSVAGVDKGNLLSGTYLATIDGTNGDLPGLGMWFQKATQRPAFTYQDATSAPKIIDLPNQEDVQAVQSNVTAEQATRADQVATLTANVSDCVSGVYGKSSSDYQIQGLYQQGSTGRAIAVFNNGTATVYNGIANYTDVTAEASARETADATIQSNLTAFQAQQANTNATLGADISNCVSGIYGKGSGDYQMLGLYQQGTTGRPVAVFNNGTTTVYNGIANYTDVTAEVSARETADATIQSNLTTFQASQADQNSAFSSAIASRVPTNAENDGVNAPITLFNYFVGDGTPWASANGVSFSLVKSAPGTGFNKILNISTDGAGNLVVPDGSGRTSAYAPCSAAITSDTVSVTKIGGLVIQTFTATITNPAGVGGSGSVVVSLPQALTQAIQFAKGNAINGTQGTTEWIPSVNVFPTSLSEVTIYADNLQSLAWTSPVTVQILVVGI